MRTTNKDSNTETRERKIVMPEENNVLRLVRREEKLVLKPVKLVMLVEPREIRTERMQSLKREKN